MGSRASRAPKGKGGLVTMTRFGRFGRRPGAAGDPWCLETRRNLLDLWDAEQSPFRGFEVWRNIFVFSP